MVARVKDRWYGLGMIAVVVAAVGGGGTAQAGMVTYDAVIIQDTLVPNFGFQVPQFDPSLFAADPSRVRLVDIDLAFEFTVLDDLYFTYDGEPGDVGIADLTITRSYSIGTVGVSSGGPLAGDFDTIELEAGSGDRRIYTASLADTLNVGPNSDYIGTGTISGLVEYLGNFDFVQTSGDGTFGFDVGDSFIFGGSTLSITYTFTVTTVPAPPPLVGLGVTAALVGLNRLRRRAFGRVG
ncbi:MAG: hypothetical protein K2X87_27820 [Gemmataceae bacterium]|nr:hypothetical protein [Gemmataceae bacterium]